ncbi:hypothetical protein PIB30_016544 [Stylosanthes scabra]|uniref:Uncharacterized protein n=1 Tax=Stylosanthes scabra TaxID=79078 RepID=A0ABU6R7P7_9FABA|nr:hypothetical protein [Stylosanthes scabra]
MYVPVLNVEGMLGQDENGVLKYADGETKTFQPIDIDLLLFLKIDATTSEHASNSANAPQTPMDPLEKARKSKKKKSRMTPATDIGHAEEVELSQSTPTLEEPHAPSSTPPADPTPARFRMKQPIIRPPPQQHLIQMSHKHSPSYPLLVSGLLGTTDKS